MRNIILLLVLIAGLIASCSDSSDDYPKVYTSDKAVEGALRLFTGEGEILNQQLIESFIARHKQQVINVDAMNVKDRYVVTYQNATDIVIEANGKEEQGKAYEIDNVIYWEHPDTLTTFFKIPYNKYQPIYSEEFNIPSTTGYNKTIRYKDCIYAEKHEGTIRLPMVAMFSKETDPDQGSIVSNYYQANNVILIDILFKQHPYWDVNDTIIIQDYYIELR